MHRSLVLVSSLALAAPAQAGTVTFDEVREERYHATEAVWNTLRYTGGADEANAVTLTLSADRVVVRDAGADITAPETCTRIGAREVSCPAGLLPGATASSEHPIARVLAGDGNDSVRVEGTGMVILDGGYGDDDLAAGPGSDQLTGGPGADVLAGADGDDSLYDTDLTEAHVDRYDGGAGRDWLYHETRGPWTVDLGAGTASNNGEVDTVAGIEAVRGGYGADRLTGSVGDDTLLGGGGADVLTGDAGDDLLAPSPNRVYRGYGYSVRWGRWDGTSDQVSCGPGDDTVATPHLLDVLEGCELMGSYVDPLTIAPDPVRVTSREATFRVTAMETSDPFALRLTARAGRRVVLVGRGRGTAAGDVRVALTPRGQELHARPGGLPVSVVVRVREEVEQFYDDPLVVIRRIAFNTVL